MEKPRLIDANALNIRDVSPSYWSHVLGVEKEDIDDAPTVEAIPIEWIREYIKKRPFALAYEMMEAWALGKEE